MGKTLADLRESAESSRKAFETAAASLKDGEARLGECAFSVLDTNHAVSAELCGVIAKELRELLEYQIAILYALEQGREVREVCETFNISPFKLRKMLASLTKGGDNETN